MKRTVVLALAAQVAILGAVAAPRLSVRLTGEEYRMRVRPVDPIDPFRGAYLTLRYDGIPDGSTGTLPEGDVYVPLARSGDLWVGTRPTVRRPASGPYLRCAGDGWQLRCGIEDYFVPQSKARELERELANGGVAVVRISGSGRAVVVGLEA